MLFLGQLVSFVMALMSFSASLTASLGVDTPLTLSFFSYTALALVYGSTLIYRRQKLMVALNWYLLLGFVDVQGNFLVNKAFQYSSITSVTLLDCWTIAWVIILTWIFLRTRYSLWQFLGSAVCVAGLALVLLSDAGVGDGGGDISFFLSKISSLYNIASLRYRESLMNSNMDKQKVQFIAENSQCPSLQAVEDLF